MTKNTMKNKLLAFHGDTAIKDKYLLRIEAYRTADEIRSGFYWEKGMGCAVGCTLHSGDHSASETELGIPTRLAYANYRIFERLFRIEPTLAKEWPGKFLKSVPVGADLSLVFPKWMLFILSDKKVGVLQYAKTERTKAAIEGVIQLYMDWIKSEQKPEATQWRSVGGAAADATTAAAGAAAAAGDGDAADGAAAAAADATAAAADATRREFYLLNGYWPRWCKYRGWYLDTNKGQTRYLVYADKLLEIMAESPIVSISF